MVGPVFYSHFNHLEESLKKRPKRKIEKSPKNLIEIDYGEIAFDIDV